MKNKILLIYPKTGVGVLKPQSPLSLLTLCPGLISQGFQPVIVDTRLAGTDFKSVIKQHLAEALFVGLSTMTGQQIHHALEVAAWIRQIDPAMKLVWGGIHPSLLPEETIRHPLVDMVVVGEGEETIVELAQALSQGREPVEVRGLCYKNRQGEIVKHQPRPLLDLSRVATPSWHLVNVDDYSEIGVQAGRGCPWRCRFCYNIQYNERRWRAKSVDQIMDELQLLKRRYGVNQVTFYDDNFFSNPKRVRELAERMVAENLGIRWSTTCRADYLAHYDDDFIDLLKRSGVHILFVGSESGSPKVLKYISKDITTDDIQGMARTTRKHGLRVHTSFMLGFPVENEEDRRLTYAMMDKIREIDPQIYITTTCIYTPYPGNEMFNDAVNAGFRPPSDLEGWSRFTFFECQLPWLKPRDRRRLESLAFITRFVFWHREIKERYLKWYYYPFYYPLRLSALLRWRLRWFAGAWEWKAFSRFVAHFSD
jgi:radical SAM superfamily enzyme YgiQ (UPF0313 family)